MLQQFEQHEILTELLDRRSNSVIQTHQRKKFDRRSSYRAGMQALIFLQAEGTTRHGTLLDISDMGACIELNNAEPNGRTFFTMGIPLLSNKKITCEVVWSQKHNGKGLAYYGVKFLDLTAREKTELRKKYLLNESLLMTYADKMIAKGKGGAAEIEVKSFFLLDVRMALERFIDIDAMISQDADDKKIAGDCKETLDKLPRTNDWLEAYLDEFK